MSRRIEKLLSESAQELFEESDRLLGRGHGELDATARQYYRAADIVAAMAGYFSEAGTTTEQDILLETIDIKPLVDRTPPTPPPRRGV